MNEYGSIYQFENQERIAYLIASYVKGTLTQQERKELDEWILESEKNEELFDELTKEENIAKTIRWYESIDEQKVRQRIKKRIAFTTRGGKVISFPFAAVAASIILIIAVSTVFLIEKKTASSPDKHTSPTVATQDVLPGSDKAILTLQGGKKIVLDSSAPKNIEGAEIVDGTIAYGSDVPPTENLLTVPRGGQYRVLLSDGTKVWLNAESSLKYPTVFTGGERKVVLTGEGYFEVSKNKEKPFIVETSESEVKVLGTKFNIDSYGDEAISMTTLVEGSVQISKGTASRVLKPGEQGRIKESKIEVALVDTKEYTAWKEGEFVFRDMPVHTIVRQLARWYDLEVELRDPVDKHLNATIKRDVPLSKVLHYLEQTGDVHFKTEGTKLIVMK